MVFIIIYIFAVLPNFQGEVTYNLDSIPQMPGWPKDIGAHAHGVTLADINGNGYLEILLGTRESLSFYVWDYLGNNMPGWPKVLQDTILNKAAVGDVDPQYPGLEIFIIGKFGYLYAWHSDGTTLAGWPTQVLHQGGVHKSPVIFDLDGNGTLEVIVCYDYWIYIFNPDGTIFDGWPLIHQNVATPSVADVDNDGVTEICAQSLSSLCLFDEYGNVEPGWPVTIDDSRSGYKQPVCADLDSDGDLEILRAYSFGHPIFQNYIGIYHHNATNFTNWPQMFPGAGTFTTPVVGDIDCDGDLEIFGGGHRPVPYASLLARHHTGDSVFGWPVRVHYMECTPVIFDMDINDGGRKEIVVNNNGGSEPGQMHAFNDNGSTVHGWPTPSGCSFPNSPAVGDVDGDGDIEIAFVCSGKVHLWTLDGMRFLPYLIEWGSWFHDNWNTGWFHPKAPQNLTAQSGPANVHLTWDANTEPDIAGYNVWRSESPNNLYGKTKVNSTLITGTEYFDVPPQETTLYYYCVTTRIHAETESRLSNEVSGYVGILEHHSRPVTLYSITPNPFTNILKFNLPEKVTAKISIYDCKGSLVQDMKCRGSVQWTPHINLPTGVYFIHIETLEQDIIRKVVKLK